MRALITGSCGFVGAHLVNHLRAQPGLEVFGVARGSRTGLPERTFTVDLTDDGAVANLIRDVRPDLVFHLAAQAAVPVSFGSPRDTLVNNIVGQLNLTEAILASGLRPRMLVVGSADEYGVVRPEELPIREDNPLRPNSPYAVSKVAQDMLGYQYFASHGLHIVRVRPFNHIGPGQSDLFASASFARQIAEIEAGLREPVLLVGNLQAKRDFTDVRDIVVAYRLLLERGVAGEDGRCRWGSCWSCCWHRATPESKCGRIRQGCVPPTIRRWSATARRLCRRRGGRRPSLLSAR